MDSSTKPGGPGWSLISAFLAVVLAWATSVAVMSHGLLYLLDNDVSISGLVKFFMVVPMGLTAVSFEAVRRGWSSLVVWICAILQVMFSTAFLVYFLLYFNLGLLHFAVALFMFWSAARLSIDEGPTVHRIASVTPTVWTRLNGFSERREEPRE